MKIDNISKSLRSSFKMTDDDKKRGRKETIGRNMLIFSWNKLLTEKIAPYKEKHYSSG